MEIRKIVLLAIAATAAAAHADQPASVGLMEEIVVTAERPTRPAMEEVIVTARMPGAAMSPTAADERSMAIEEDIRAQLLDYAQAPQPNLLF